RRLICTRSSRTSGAAGIRISDCGFRISDFGFRNGGGAVFGSGLPTLTILPILPILPLSRGRRAADEVGAAAEEHEDPHRDERGDDECGHHRVRQGPATPVVV